MSWHSYITSVPITDHISFWMTPKIESSFVNLFTIQPPTPTFPFVKGFPPKNILFSPSARQKETEAETQRETHTQRERERAKRHVAVKTSHNTTLCVHVSWVCLLGNVTPYHAAIRFRDSEHETPQSSHASGCMQPRIDWVASSAPSGCGLLPDYGTGDFLPAPRAGIGHARGCPTVFVLPLR